MRLRFKARGVGAGHRAGGLQRGTIHFSKSALVAAATAAGDTGHANGATAAREGCYRRICRLIKTTVLNWVRIFLSRVAGGCYGGPIWGPARQCCNWFGPACASWAMVRL